ncbi:LacI family DNA-binding transcriptional regulator [Tumebacillus permanentifrigoris]|uniref:LacI family transcriptional regulator n=1 Tax=Tumebacillus permanentifrigoris TaxID=378543 RepID=A0A316D3K0_9BACL|nr:LacI family DNA-binding transcriptional regulator [Tumebacillus permanentifrigoris]PWK06003.1 LacI family transcriptional regulator [Tumebacillus permanentifrigoris]
MTATIKDVAARAGVSPSTVSRVISNHPRISEKTKREVRAAMEELGYHPNMLARSLAKKSSDAIGVLIPSTTEEFFMNPFFPEVLRGITDVAKREGYDLLLSTSDSGKEDVRSLTRMIHGKRVDGVLLLSSRMQDPLMQVLQENPFPATLIGRPEINLPISWVNNNNVEACYQATRHLIGLGHKRIGFLGGDETFVVTRDRLQGYHQALDEAGIPQDRRLMFASSFVEQGGYLGMTRLLALPDRPSAVVASDDLLAFGAMRAAGELGYRIPEDIAVVGFNNVRLTEMSNPSLTSVDVQIYELGVTAANLLIEQMRGGVLMDKHVIVPTQMVIRNSCGGRK